MHLHPSSMENLAALYASLQNRPRPEDVAELILAILGPQLSVAEHTLLLKAATAGSLQRGSIRISSMLQDFQRSKRIVEALRTLGCTVAIDDFGTGYSSVSLLRHLPVSRIKIDRSFVSALPGRAQDTGLVSAMLGMAHSLGLEVTAEGIETAEQAGLLAEMANLAAQGYYFERPQPAEFFSADWLSRHSAA